MILIDLYQQRQIGEASAKADKALGKASLTEAEIADLQRKADALTIACQALWEIVKDRLQVDEGELLTKVQSIDARDGRTDGKISASVLECSQCRRKTSSKRRNCLYCGHSLHGGSVFEKS